MRTVAFFDIDGTLYRDSLMIAHFKKLLKYEILDQALWHTELKHKFEDWKKRRGDYDEYMIELAEVYIESLKGLDRYKVEFITDQVITLSGDKVYMYTRDRIQWHKDQGHKVIFISGGPEYLVSRMAEKYGADDFIGTKYLLDENYQYTGEVVPMWDAESKHGALTNFVEKYDVDLNSSFAYGDTNGDISMFNMVGNPVAINPTRELLDNIRASSTLCESAKVIIERKDLIYELSPKVKTYKLSNDF